MSQPVLTKDRTRTKDAGTGLVSLVGAGPGDPDLLTVKALRCIQRADVILYDNLVSEAIRQLFPASAQTEFVGKSRCQPGIGQARINRRLIELAKQGKRICRLKGGDPFIFGRGSEEMLKLQQAGIAVEVVPGITAASGCTSYAGIPLTHRGLSQSFTVVTGHGASSLDLDWPALAKGNQTLVFYMALDQLPHITSQLLSHGMAATTPAALIENGCRPEQRVHTGPLNQLPLISQHHRFTSPSLIVIGEVTRLADALAWYGESVPVPQCQIASA